MVSDGMILSRPETLGGKDSSLAIVLRNASSFSFVADSCHTSNFTRFKFQNSDQLNGNTSLY